MRQTLGYHCVKSGYGLWLPGDARGSWSESWDDRVGFVAPHALHPGDPVRLRMARERLKYDTVRLSPAMIDAVVATLDKSAAASPWKIGAASIESTHLHVLITYSRLDIDRTLKWLAQEMTKAIHRTTDHAGPVWCEGWWCGFLFDAEHWAATTRYIERHNIRRGENSQPYPFIENVEPSRVKPAMSSPSPKDK